MRLKTEIRIVSLESTVKYLTQQVIDLVDLTRDLRGAVRFLLHENKEFQNSRLDEENKTQRNAQQLREYHLENLNP